MDPFFAVIDAQQRLAEAQKRVNELQAKGRIDSKAYEEAIREAIEAQAGFNAELTSYREQAREAESGTRGTINALERLAQQAGLSDKDIADLIATAERLEKGSPYITEVQARTETARRELAQLRAALAALPSHVSITTDVRQSGTGVAQHAGGIVGSGGFRRMHEGGTVGDLRSDERLIIAQVGEGIIPRSLMRSMASAQQTRGGGAPVVNLSVNLGYVFARDKQKVAAEIADAVHSELLKKQMRGPGLGFNR